MTPTLRLLPNALRARAPLVVPCECPSTAHCLEALGGEQGDTADELLIHALRLQVAAAREAIGPAWFSGTTTLAEAIRAKVAYLETLSRRPPPLRRGRVRAGEGAQ